MEIKRELTNYYKYKIRTLRRSLFSDKIRLLDFAKQHGYREEILNILENKDFSEKTIEMFNKQAEKQQTKHLSDHRTLYQYDLDIILGWILEDYIVDQSFGIYSLNGSDKNRDVVNDKITNRADLMNNLTHIPTEVHSEYFSRHGEKLNKTIVLRDNKYLNLLKENADLLVYNVPQKKYMLKNIRDFQYRKIDYFEKYNKSAYELYIPNISQYFQDANIFFKRLKTFIKK